MVPSPARTLGLLAANMGNDGTSRKKVSRGHCFFVLNCRHLNVPGVIVTYWQGSVTAFRFKSPSSHTFNCRRSPSLLGDGTATKDPCIAVTKRGGVVLWANYYLQ